MNRLILRIRDEPVMWLINFKQSKEGTEGDEERWLYPPDLPLLDPVRE
jgi:hypothetical protein